MKKLTLLLLTLWLAISCNNDDGTVNLPEATTTGAGTFACRVNGKPFIAIGQGYFNCFYQYLNGDYYFGITANDKGFKNSDLPWSIGIGAIKVDFEEGKTYILTSEGDGNVTGDGFFSISSNNSEWTGTSVEYTGELTITKLPGYLEPNIISGTFWFDIEHPTTGETVHITEGRFDTLYLQ